MIFRSKIMNFRSKIINFSCLSNNTSKKTGIWRFPPKICLWTCFECHSTHVFDYILQIFDKQIETKEIIYDLWLTPLLLHNFFCNPFVSYPMQKQHKNPLSYLFPCKFHFYYTYIHTVTLQNLRNLLFHRRKMCKKCHKFVISYPFYNPFNYH